MSLLGMLLDASTIGNRNPFDDRYFNGGSKFALSGIRVDQDAALRLSTVWACTRILSSTIACLPIKIMRDTSTGPIEVEDHPVSWCMEYWPNNEMGPKTFRSSSTPQQVNAGNCYAEIVRGPEGVQVWPIHQSRVTPARRKEDNALAWQVKNDGSEPTNLLDDDVLHVKSHMSTDGILGMGVIEYARETIGFGLAVEQEGASRFANACRPEVVIEGGKFRDDDARNFYRQTWAERHQGTGNRGKPAMLPPDAKLHKLEYSAVDQQFIESSQFNVEAICRWYGVPPHMVQHLLRATFSNIEWMGQDFVTYSLLPWIGMWEEEIDRKLLGKTLLQQGYYSRFDVDELMRGDSAARSTFYDRMVNQVGAMNPNQVAAREGLPHIGPAGDKYRAPLNMTTLDKLGEAPPIPVDGKLIQRPKPGGQQGDPDEEPQKEKQDNGLAALTAATLTAFQGLQREVWGLRDALGKRRRKRVESPQPVSVETVPTEDGRIESAKTAALDSLLDVARIMVHKEIQQAQAASRTPMKFLDRCQEFYDKHCVRASASLAKPAGVVAALEDKTLAVEIAVALHCDKAREELLAASECQPEQLEEAVNAVVMKWDTRAAELVKRIIGE